MTRRAGLPGDCLKNTTTLVYGAGTGTVYRVFMSRRMQSCLLLLPAGLVALLLGSCGRPQSAQAEEAGSPDVSVAVAKATVEDISHKVTLTAEFKPFQEIEVMAKVAGYVKKINVDVGDRVQEGQLLALIEIPEMADDQARAQSQFNRDQA